MPERSTVYLDLDDDITAIIGKLNQSEHEQVAMVVPKRSSVLQSVVNLKLVKKSAVEADKKPVLITEDPVITKIAAGQNMLVATSLQATAQVPEVEKMTPMTLPSDVIDGTALEPVKTAATSTVKPAAPPFTEESEAKPIPPTPTSPPGGGKGKKRRVPDFDRFKKRFLLAIGAIAGVGLLIWALFYYLPKGHIVINGRTEPVNLSFDFTADSEVDKPQYDNNLLPGVRKELNKTLSQNVTATGKKDVGTKASGEVTIRNCDDGNGFSMSSGSKFTSESGKVFVSTEGVSVPGFTGNSSDCAQDGDSAGTATVAVRAAANGESYNIDSQAYTFTFSSPKIDAVGSEMTGGSSKTITIITKSDVDAARAELVSGNRNKAKADLTSEFGEDDLVIDSSFTQRTTKVTAEPAIGEEATSGRVTLEISYSLLAVRKAHLDELAKRQGNKQTADADSLAVVDSALDDAEIKLKDKNTTAYRFSVKTEALLGPDIDFTELKARVAGKKTGETAEIVKGYPNVSDVEVDLSPFWVFRVPRDPAKVTVEIKLPEGR